MSDPGAGTEREITRPVALCTPDGRLNPDAVGWSRRPLHDCALPGTWGRRKRWDFWGVTGPGFALNLVYADVDYVGIADVWFHDFGPGRRPPPSVPVPLARGVALPDHGGRRRHALRRTWPDCCRSWRRPAAPACGRRSTAHDERPGHRRRPRAPAARARVAERRHPVERPAVPVHQQGRRPAGRGHVTWGDRSYVLADGHVVGHARLRAGQVAVPHALELGCRRRHGRDGHRRGGRGRPARRQVDRRHRHDRERVVRRRPAVEAVRGAGVDLRHVPTGCGRGRSAHPGPTASTSRSPRSTTSAPACRPASPPRRSTSASAPTRARSSPTTACRSRSTASSAGPRRPPGAGDGGTGQAGARRTGRCLMPPMKFERSRSGSPSDSRTGTRAASSSNSSLISRRASWAPRQKCGPAAPEGDVRVGVAGDVEPERLVEHRLVSVGRDVPEADLLALADELAAQLDVAGAVAAEEQHGRRPAQDLLDRAADVAIGVGHQQRPLVGVVEEGVHAVGDGVAGRLVARPPTAA